ncbi:MAG: hypothetical protein JWN86_3590 [Planctomycetota bacterium]|nr:hypothetical protein [Planctomycetota bacterium]
MPIPGPRLADHRSDSSHPHAIILQSSSERESARRSTTPDAIFSCPVGRIEDEPSRCDDASRARQTRQTSCYRAVDETLFAPDPDGTTNPSSHRPEFDAQVDAALRTLADRLDGIVDRFPGSMTLDVTACEAILGDLPAGLRGRLASLPTPASLDAPLVRSIETAYSRGVRVSVWSNAPNLDGWSRAGAARHVPSHPNRRRPDSSTASHSGRS